MNEKRSSAHNFSRGRSEHKSSVSHRSPPPFSASGRRPHVDLLIEKQFPLTLPDAGFCRTTHTTPQTTFLNNFFRYLNENKNPMDQAATVVQDARRGVFGNGKTLRIEEREFGYETEGQKFKFFLVVRSRVQVLPCGSKYFSPVLRYSGRCWTVHVRKSRASAHSR